MAALAVWLIIYLRISAPVNRTLTTAATTGQIPPDVGDEERVAAAPVGNGLHQRLRRPAADSGADQPGHVGPLQTAQRDPPWCISGL